MKRSLSSPAFAGEGVRAQRGGGGCGRRGPSTSLRLVPLPSKTRGGFQVEHGDAPTEAKGPPFGRRSATLIKSRLRRSRHGSRRCAYCSPCSSRFSSPLPRHPSSWASRSEDRRVG